MATIDAAETACVNSDLFFGADSDPPWWLQYDGGYGAKADSSVVANRRALMEADVIGSSGGDDDSTWLVGTAAHPIAMNTDVYFPPTTGGEGDETGVFGNLNADLDLALTVVTIHLIDDAVSDNRNGLMRRQTLHVNPEMPFPTWDESSYNSDICFDHWPDWRALFARTQDDAAYVAALLSEAALGSEVLGGIRGGGGCVGGGGVNYGFDGSDDGGRMVMMDGDHMPSPMSSPTSSSGIAREKVK